MTSEHPTERRILGEILHEKAVAHGSRRFLRFEDESFTYAELDELANRAANGFSRLDVAHGTRVCLMLPNCPEFLFCTFGLARLGAVEVPVNTAYKGPHLRYIVDNCDAHLIVIHAQWFDRLEGVIDELPNLRHVVVLGDGEHEQLAHATVVPFGRLLKGDSQPPPAEVRHSDIQAIMYTSGTTGPSKGVLVSHCHALTFAQDWLTVNAYEEADVLYTPAPLFHVLAHTLGVFAVLLAGSEIVIVERFSARAYWDDVRRFNATVSHGVWGMVTILLNREPSPADRDHHLRSFYMGPSALSAAFEQRFGVRIVEVYGSTETGIVTCTPYGELRPGSCGLVNTGTFDAMVVDADDNELPPEDIGEILVRPQKPYAMMSGYHGKPDVTLGAYRNLWFHTGDFGRRDQDGYFYFVDRKKDAIRRRGENISSYEVEQAFNSHPAVLECAAVAVPSELGEDEVKVCIVLQDGAELQELDLIEFVDANLPYFMVPRYLELMDELPKTPSEKVEKYKLRELGVNGISEHTWDREASGYRLTR